MIQESVLLSLLEAHWQELLDPADSLFNWRKKAWDRFEAIGLPRFKQEAFQYVPLQKLAFPKPAIRPLAISKEEIERHLLPECRNSYLVFADGFFEESLSSIPSPLIGLPLEGAMRSYGIFLQNRLSRTLKEESDPFAALNGAFQGRGVFLYAPPNSKIEAPLQILHFYTQEANASPRIQLYLGRSAKLQLIQTALYPTNCLANTAFDCVLDENADLSFCDAQELPPAVHQFQAFRATLKRDSRLKMLSFTQGSVIARSTIHVQLAEENSEAQLLGLSRLKKENQAHVHALVEHAAPNTRSRQHFKVVLKDRSRSSFEGKILVRPIAQKTEAYQLNNNLVLSDEACANAKPNLEIFADDVKASHGATVSQLEKEEIFYLRSRGLSLDQAKQWLINGFCRQLIDLVPLPSLKKRLLEEL